jgi:hypothetical protein
MRTSRTITAFAVVAALAAAAPAGAQLSGSTSTTTGSTCTASDQDGFCGFSVQQQVDTGAQFKSRYAWNVNTDIGIFSTRNMSGSAQHHVNFNATAPGGYRVDIAQQRVGDLNRISDAVNCDGSADTSGITGSSNFALSSGSLNLADPGTIGNGGSTISIPFNQSGSATIFRVSNGVAQGHALTFTWSGSTRSNSCESAVRQGQPNGSTSGCTACEYPGDPGRTLANDGHFVTVDFTSLCGNGTIDGSVGEACDLGSANGVFGSCCTSQCQFASSSTVCRNSAGVCDPAENCTGSSATCPADAKSTAVCRAAAGDCDVTESCDGINDDCPANGFVSSSTVCRAAAGECDLAENCPGNAPTCPADAKKAGGTACTSDGNPCSLDQCDGTNDACQHPAGNAGATCRAAADACDVAETCDGSSTVCPADALASSGTTCRAVAGACDVAETCSGLVAACPPDLFALPSVTCRAAADTCDAPELCTGLGPDCPTDLTLPDGSVCSDGNACTSGDTCQGGACVGTGNLDTCLDDFLCYTGKVTPGTPRFTPIPSLRLADAFEDQNFRVLRVKNLCTPADKNDGNGTIDSATHLVSYQIKPAGGTHIRRTNLRVTNQLGEIRVDTIRPDLLFVPSAKDLLSPPSAPPFNSHAVDHYKCYKVRVTRGTPRFVRQQVTVTDQFVSLRLLDLKKPRHLCTPVDKNEEGIKNTAAHLLCYLAKPATGQPRFVRQRGLYVANQFGNLRVDAIKEREFCIPSLQSPSGAFLDEFPD